MNDETQPILPRQSSVAATLSALLPGLGHLYAGHFTRGILWLGASIALMIAAVISLLLNPTRTGFILMISFLSIDLIVWMVSIVEAKRLAKQSDPNYRLREYNRWYVYAILLLVCGFGSAIGIAFVLRERVVEAFVIPNASMEPNINPGDRILTLKGVFLDRAPEYGELVVFRNPEKRRQRYVKRVIGLAGDEVEWRENGEILINGTSLPQSDVGGGPEMTEEHGGQQYRIKLMENHGIPANGRVEVPPYHCFVLGDNRTQSQDSRHFGPISYTSLVALPVAKVWGGLGKLN